MRREERKKTWKGRAARFAVIATAVLCCGIGLYKNIDLADAADSYIYEEGDTVTFKVSQKIGTFYKDTMSVYPGFVMQDTIPAGLSYESASITDSAGTNITNHGTLKYDTGKRLVSFTMGSSWLASEANYKGQTLTMTIKCKALQPQTTTDVIKNIAYTNIGSLSYASNQVSLSVVKPDLVITKTADKTTYHSGEISKWTVTVTQPVTGATADNVTITESDLPAGLVIDMDTVKADDSTADIEKGENSFTVTIPALSGGKTVKVTFDAVFDSEKLADSIVKNTAKAASTTGSTKISKSAAKEVSVRNTVTTEIEKGTITGSIKDIEIGEERTVEYTPDDGYYIRKAAVDGKDIEVADPYEGSYTFKDIRENRSIKVVCAPVPVMEITKEADKEQYHSGEKVHYTIRASQTVAGATAKNIVITDEELPEGLVIDMDSVKIDDAAEELGAELEKGENSFKATIPEMDDEKAVTVSFDASFEPENLRGSDISNIAKISSDTDGVRFSKEAASRIKVKSIIDTKVKNGAITETVKDIEIGEERTIEYTPDDGYYLEKVTVDGEDVDIEKHKEAYTFRDICKNHEIEVEYIPIPALAVTKETQKARMRSAGTMGYSIRTTQTVEDAVAEDVEITDTDLPAGLVIDMDSIKVNDETATVERGENEFTVRVPEIDYEKEVEITFDTNIDTTILKAGAVNNTVLVRCNTGGEEIVAEDAQEFEVLNSITTEIENGTITDSMEDIRIGEVKTVEYTPDDGYYIQKILVDGEAVDIKETEAYAASYTFEDIRESHDIKVVCAPVPELAVTKTGQKKLEAGERMTYSVTLENVREGSVAENVTVTDIEMENGGIDFTSVRCSRDHTVEAADGGVVISLTDPLPAGETALITYEAVSTQEDKSVVKNTVYVSADGMDEPESAEHTARTYVKKLPEEKAPEEEPAVKEPPKEKPAEKKDPQQADTGDGFEPFYVIMLAALALIMIFGISLLARVEKDK